MIVSGRGFATEGRDDAFADGLAVAGEIAAEHGCASAITTTTRR